MTDRFDNNAGKTTGELAKILNRVDQLPVLDDRSPEEIIGYDENGLPAALTPSAPAVADRGTKCSVENRLI
jgi:hypothetical protein